MAKDSVLTKEMIKFDHDIQIKQEIQQGKIDNCDHGNSHDAT
jgi:hypothetical protein